MAGRRYEWCLVLAIVGLVAFVCGRTANARPLWYDERFTQHLSRYDTLEQLTTLLSVGADLNPPVSYIATHYSVQWLGESNLSIRLPSLIGGLLGIVSLFAFVRHRRSAAEAFVAMSAVVLPESVTHYFTEARPYGLMLGFAGLTLLSWQRVAIQGRSKIVAGVAMAFFASLGIATHYYFAVVLVAIGIAEVVRVVVQRRINETALAGFLAPVLALAAMMPLWRGPQKIYTEGFWAKVNPSPLEITNLYASYSDAIVLTVAILAGLLAIPWSSRRTNDSIDEPYLLWNVVALVALAAIPILAFGIAVTITKVYVPRYCVPFAIGLAGATALGLSRICQGNRVVLAMIAGLFVSAGLAVQWRWTFDRGRERHETLTKTIVGLNERSSGQFVLIEMAGPDRMDFALSEIPINYRPVLLLDVAAARENDGQDTVDRGSTALAALTCIPIVSFQDAVKEVQAGRLPLYVGTDTSWRAKMLREGGVKMTLLHTFAATRLGGTSLRMQPPVSLFRLEPETK